MKTKREILVPYFYIALISGEINSLTNHDFCMKQAKHECSGQFSYECKPDKCSVDKTACTYFGSLAFTLRAYKSRSNYVHDLKKFNDFKRRIVKCTLPKYELEVGDFCSNDFKCLAIEYDVIRRERQTDRKKTVRLHWKAFV